MAEAGGKLLITGISYRCLRLLCIIGTVSVALVLKDFLIIFVG